MIKLCIFVGTMVGGYGAWWAADAAGFGFFAAFMISGLGSIVGVWAGWKVGRRFE